MNANEDNCKIRAWEESLDLSLFSLLGVLREGNKGFRVRVIDKLSQLTSTYPLDMNRTCPTMEKEPVRIAVSHLPSEVNYT